MSAFSLQWPKNNETLFYHQYTECSTTYNLNNQKLIIQSKHDIGWFFRPVKFLASYSFLYIYIKKGCYVVTLRLLKDSDYQAHFTAAFNILLPSFHLKIIWDLVSCSRLFPSWLPNFAWAVWISNINLCHSEILFHW